MDLQFITSNSVAEGRRQAFGEAVNRENFEYAQAERARAEEDRANQARRDQALRDVIARQATGDTMYDDVARSLSAIPGGGQTGLESIEARNTIAADAAEAERTRALEDRKRADQMEELAWSRGFDLLNMGAGEQARQVFESAGIRFPPAFYADRAMQARVQQAGKTIKDFYGHDPQGGAKVLAAVMQGTPIEQAMQQTPPAQKQAGGGGSLKEVIGPDGKPMYAFFGAGSSEGVPATMGGNPVTPYDRPSNTPRPTRQTATIALSDGSVIEVAGTVGPDGQWRPMTNMAGNPVLSENSFGLSPEQQAELMGRIGLGPMPSAPQAVDEPNMLERIKSWVTGSEQGNTATSAQQPSWPDAMAGASTSPQPAPSTAAPAPQQPAPPPSMTEGVTATPEGIRFPDGAVVNYGGMVYVGDVPHIVRGASVDPNTGETVIDIVPTGQ